MSAFVAIAGAGGVAAVVAIAAILVVAGSTRIAAS